MAPLILRIPPLHASTDPSRARRLSFALGGLLLCLALQAHASVVMLSLPVVVLGIGIGAARRELDLDSALSRIEAALLVMLLIWGASALQGLDPARSFALSTPLLFLLLIVFGLGRLRAAEDFRTSVPAVLGALATAWSVALLMSDEADPASRIERLGAPWLVVPNDLAWVGLMWPAWIRCLGRSLLQGPTLRSGVIGLSLALQFAALMSLQSRIGVAACLLAAASTVWVRPGRQRHPGRPWIMLGLVLLMPAILLLGAGDGLLQKSLAGWEARVQLQQVAFHLFLDRPWLGVGPHGFVLAYLPWIDAAGLVDPRLTPWPHNLVLELLAETGLLGCGAFAGLLVCACPPRGERLVAVIRTFPVLAAALLLVCFEASTLRLWFWMLLALALAHSQQSRPGSP